MRRLTRAIAITIVATLQLAACAYAEEGILPSKTTFTGTSGATTFETAGGLKVACGKGTLSEGIFKLSDSNGTASFHFTECTAAGFSVNSLGDAKGIILIPEAQILTCLTTPEKLEFGIVVHMMRLGPMGETEPKPLHLEVPAVAILSLITGSALGRLTMSGKGKEMVFSFKQKKGAQEPPKCTYEDGKSVEYKLLLEENENKKPVALGLEVEEKVTFGGVVELMDK